MKLYLAPLPLAPLPLPPPCIDYSVEQVSSGADGGADS